MKGQIVMNINKIAQGLAKRPLVDLSVKTPKIKSNTGLKLPKTVMEQEMLNDLIMLAQANAAKVLLNLK